jgi:hypothetical protein
MPSSKQHTRSLLLYIVARIYIPTSEFPCVLTAMLILVFISPVYRAAVLDGTHFLSSYTRFPVEAAKFSLKFPSHFVFRHVM